MKVAIRFAELLVEDGIRVGSEVLAVPEGGVDILDTATGEFVMIEETCSYYNSVGACAVDKVR